MSYLFIIMHNFIDSRDDNADLKSSHVSMQHSEQTRWHAADDATYITKIRDLTCPLNQGLDLDLPLKELGLDVGLLANITSSGLIRFHSVNLAVIHTVSPCGVLNMLLFALLDADKD